MNMFARDDDEELLEDDGSIFGRSEHYERRKQALERAREIHSGLVSGLFEKDELVWEFVKKLDKNR